MLKEALAQRIGAHRVQEIPSSIEGISFLILDIELQVPVTVVITNGLANYAMPMPENLLDEQHKELFISLPDYWEWNEIDNPRRQWVFALLEKLVLHCLDKKSWFATGHTVSLENEASILQYMPKTASGIQDHLWLTNPIALSEVLAPIPVSGYTIFPLAVIPIYKKEFEYKQNRGSFKLLQRFNQVGATETVDEFRQDIHERKWKLKFW